MALRLLALLLCLALPAHLRADVITLKSGGQVEGEVLSETPEQVVVRLAAGTVTLPRNDILLIERKPFGRAEGGSQASGARGRLPDAAGVKKVLRTTTWARGLKQIPATVLADGPTRHIPYTSFRAAEDYEINIYGDPAAPVAVEIGVRNMLARSEEAKKNVAECIAALMTDEGDRKTAAALDRAKDKQIHDGLVFEVRPPGPTDTDGAWFIWVYDDRTMDHMRAGEKELADISVPARARPARYVPPSRKRNPDPVPGGDPWTEEELKYARPSDNSKAPRVYVREYVRAKNAYAPANAPPK